MNEDEYDATLRFDDKSKTNNSDESLNKCKVGRPHEEGKEAHDQKQQAKKKD
jgi:hypothetical protein